MKTVLLTIGRLPKALDFARSFHGAGWRVLVAEPFKSHLTGASNSVAASFVVPAPSMGKQAYLEALAQLVVAKNVDLVLPLSEETMHVSFLAPLLPAHVRVFAPKPATVLCLHDKAAFAALAAANHLSIPDTATLGTQQADAIAAAGDYVIKPIFSCSGRGVSLHKAGTPLPMIDASDTHKRAVVQRQLRGQEYSTFAITHEGKVLINVVYQGAIKSGSVAVAFERVAQPCIDDWVRKFVARVQYSGFISFDFFVDEIGVATAIECNPRVTSGVHFIDTSGLVDAILAPQQATMTLKPITQMMQFYPTLTEVQSRAWKPGSRDRVKSMMASRDVTWLASDPIPFITMPITAFTIIAKSITEQKSFGEVSTADIAWFEGEVTKQTSESTQ